MQLADDNTGTVHAQAACARNHIAVHRQWQSAKKALQQVSAPARSAATPPPADSSVSVEAPEFWTKAYSVRLKRDGTVACPDFLQPQVAGILSAGKSQALLRTHQQPRGSRCPGEAHS